MYEVKVCLKNRDETVKFYSDWAARIMAEKWSACYDVERTIVINGETGELGYEFVNGKPEYIGSVDF